MKRQMEINDAPPFEPINSKMSQIFSGFKIYANCAFDANAFIRFCNNRQHSARAMFSVYGQIQ